MSDESRCCGGRCCSTTPIDLNRRDFMEKIAVGTAALAVIGDLGRAAEFGTDDAGKLTPPKEAESKYPKTPPRVYKGEHLEAVAMPIGGIGTGSIWLDGQGRLSVWQIFNNLNETRVPDSFFAVRAKVDGKEAVARILQTVGEAGLKPVESLQYEAGYPIARLTFHDPALPVQIVMEALNPMIPLDAANSSIPCALFRLTATNNTKNEADVSFFASLQNAVGSGSSGDIKGVRFAGYGGNANNMIGNRKWTAITMKKSPDPVPTGPLKVRDANGREVPGPELFWIAGLSDLNAATAEPILRIAREGGVLVADGVSKDFFVTLKALREKHRDFNSVATVFEDFEKKTYEGWTITGTAFGKGPSHGTEPNQQPVSGFAGRGFVNTYRGSDEPHGTATSKPFKIERRYIGFLIGGGNHPNETCINLRVGGKVVRTTTGKNQEALEPASWDVADLNGKEAMIEIVDHRSDGWGHINIDQIIFSDVPPEPLLRDGTAIAEAARAIEIAFDGAESSKLIAGAGVENSERVLDLAGAWPVTDYTRLDGFHSNKESYRTLAKSPDGNPLLIEGPLGKGRIILALAPRLPWSWGQTLLIAERRKWLKSGGDVTPGNAAWGTMALAAFDEEAAVSLPEWSTAKQVRDFIEGWPRRSPMEAPARVDSEPQVAFGSAAPRDDATSKDGETINAAIEAPLKVKPGESKSVTFAITWHFPNVRRFQHSGNFYTRRFRDANAIATYLAENLDALWQRTRLYQDTLYQSNLPEEFLDALSSQSVILRGPTCWMSEEGYFGGFEGSYGCCPLNCTHVWNYAQTHARLFPSIGQNMRVSNFITFLHPSGETSHREHAVHNAFIDGHCACIEAAYREYQLSPDQRFLEKIWPGVKKAVDWVIGAIDPKRDGVPHGKQWNTYDTAVSGANTFIGSQYLSALAAGARMAEAMNEPESARAWETVLEAGKKSQNEKLWNGEYYIQIPEAAPDRDYDTGCFADQLLGQWWAHMLGLGYLYPPQRVKSAMAAIMKHNFRDKFAGFKQDPRRYIPDDDGGLIICTWPRGGRPKPFLLYADECWTGIEYATAGAMVFEGLIDDARRIVRTARERYDGRRRDGLDSGPGGNPFNELECGKFYARAMSSWSLLIASQGLVLEGPKGVLGFKPRWQPEDHRSFFTAPEGWGLFVQQRKPGEQIARIEVRHGRLKLRELAFELPKGGPATAAVSVAGKPIAATLHQSGAAVRIVLEQETIVSEGSAIEATLRQTA